MTTFLARLKELEINCSYGAATSKASKGSFEAFEDKSQHVNLKLINEVNPSHAEAKALLDQMRSMGYKLSVEFGRLQVHEKHWIDQELQTLLDKNEEKLIDILTMETSEVSKNKY